MKPSFPLLNLAQKHLNRFSFVCIGFKNFLISNLFVLNSLSTSSTGTFFGQYSLFLIIALLYTPLYSKCNNPFATQKPLSHSTSFPYLKIGFYILSINPTAFPNFYNSFGPHFWGQYLPSTIHDLQSIDVIPHQMFCFLPPKLFELFPIHIHHRAYLLNNYIIPSSITLIQ